MICIFDVVTGPATGKRFWLKSNQCLEVGRFSSVDVSIPADRHLSRRHCLIDSFADGFRIRDIGSANGTFVNDQPITVEVLRHGDTVRIGLTTMEVSIRQGNESPHSRDGLNFGRGPAAENHEPNLAEDTVRFRPGQLKPLSPLEQLQPANQILPAQVPATPVPPTKAPAVPALPSLASPTFWAPAAVEESGDERPERDLPNGRLSGSHLTRGQSPAPDSDSAPRIWGVETPETTEKPVANEKPPAADHRASTTDWPDRTEAHRGEASQAKDHNLKRREDQPAAAASGKPIKPKTIAFVPPAETSRAAKKWLAGHFRQIGSSHVYELTATFRSQYGEMAGLLPQLCGVRPFGLVVNIAQLDAASKQLFDQLVYNSSAKPISRTLLYNVLDLTDEIKRFLSFSSGQDAVVCLIGGPPPESEVLKNFANSLSYPSMLASHLQDSQSDLVRMLSMAGVQALFEMETSGRIGLFQPTINESEAAPR